MSEIRERLEEIRRLAGEDFPDLDEADVLAEIHEDATKALALLDESEPVASIVRCEDCDSANLTYWVNGYELHCPTCRGVDNVKLELLYTSPTPTQANDLDEALDGDLMTFLATVGASRPDDHPWVTTARKLADRVNARRQKGAGR